MTLKLSISTAFLFSAFLVHSCKKKETTTPVTQPNPTTSEQAASINTLTVTNITDSTALLGGQVVSEGSSTVTERGICYASIATPTTANLLVKSGVGTGNFSVKLSKLASNTTYYARAYAINSQGTVYGSILSFKTSGAPKTLALGDTIAGGYVFFLDATGAHGMVAAPGDFRVYTSWGCMGTNIAGTSTALGSGKKNTELIVSKCSTAGIAARLCYDLVYAGFDDWYLPSKDELYLIHQNLYLKGKGNLSLGRYWSSSQYDANNVWVQFFNNNLNQLYYDKVLVDYPVRAVRSF